MFLIVQSSVYSKVSTASSPGSSPSLPTGYHSRKSVVPCLSYPSLPWRSSFVISSFKHGVGIWVCTGKKRIDKKHSSKTFSYRSCRWISFWEGKIAYTYTKYFILQGHCELKSHATHGHRLKNY